MQADAFRLSELAIRGPFGRTKLFDFVRRGILPARKVEGTTFVLEADWRRFLDEAPLATQARGAAHSKHLTTTAA